MIFLVPKPTPNPSEQPDLPRLISASIQLWLARLLSGNRWASALRSTLPGPGQGTLAGRLYGIPVRAKTGTLLAGVSALSGWLRLRSRRWAAFSILSRGLAKSRAVGVEDRLVALFARASI